MIVFDIETGPLPEPELRQLLPEFTPPPHPGTFNPATVRHGNTKDPGKRAQKEAEEEAKHLNAVAGYEQSVVEAQAQHWQEFVDKAALSATTGRVLAIGLLDAGKGEEEIRILAHDNENPDNDLALGDEATALHKFWRLYSKARATNANLVGCNIFDFDLPFLIRRSWMLGVDVPATVTVNRRYFDSIFVDLREVWLCGQRGGNGGEKSSLDTIGRALGVGGKPDGVTGADFARLWFGTPEEKATAVEYLKNDLRVTAGAAGRMGIL